MEQFRELFVRYQASPHRALQTTRVPDVLDALYEEAKQYIQYLTSLGQLVEAQQAVDLAWEIASQTRQPQYEAMAHWCSAILHVNRDVHRALCHIESARSYFHDSGQGELEARILIGYASQKNLLGQLDEAEAAIRQVIEALTDVPDYRDWPMVYINQAYIQGQQGHYVEMLKSARKANALAQDFQHSQPARAKIYQWQQGQALVNEAWALICLARFHQAREQLEHAFQIAEEIETTELAGRAALNLARVYSFTGQPFAALQALHTARQRFAAAGAEIDLATIDLIEANLYERLKILPLARNSALRAADIMHKHGIHLESVEARLLAVRLTLALNEPTKAQDLLDETPPVSFSQSPLLAALLQGYQVHPYLRVAHADPAQAVATAQAAVQTVGDLSAPQELLELQLILAALAESVGNSNADDLYWSVIHTAQEHSLPLLEQASRERLAVRQPATLAIETLRQATRIVQNIQGQLRSEELKANLLSGHAPLYRRLFEAQFQAGRVADALQTVLEAKGSLWVGLVGRIATSEVDPYLARSRAELAYWQEALRSNSEAGYRTLCEAKIQQTRLAVAEASRLRTDSSPEYPLPTVAEIQVLLDKKSAIIEFMHGVEGLYACVVTATGEPIWVKLTSPATIRELLAKIELWRKAIQLYPPEMRILAAPAQETFFQGFCHELYEALWQPCQPYLHDIEAVYLVPHEYLFDVPWTALYDGSRYLGEQYTVSLAPSSVVFPLYQHAEGVRPNREHETANDCLVLWHRGDPPLLFAEAEAQAIQAIMPNTSVRASARCSDMRQPTAPRFLHVVVHGKVEKDEPLFSSLQFADGDYLLADVLQLNLYGTELVTLSACDTVMLPKQGGVTLALAGAFLCAGAQTVLATLWSVDDKATLPLMTAFYTALQEGYTIPAALQIAQKTLRAQPAYTHPFYWAAFQPICRMMPVQIGCP